MAEPGSAKNGAVLSNPVPQLEIRSEPEVRALQRGPPQRESGNGFARGEIDARIQLGLAVRRDVDELDRRDVGARQFTQQGFEAGLEFQSR